MSHMTSCYFFFFFFQAEDGIRDTSVTGVQTCALPIYRRCAGPRPATARSRGQRRARGRAGGGPRRRRGGRSEERRVGKECRCRGWAEHEKKREREKKGG